MRREVVPWPGAPLDYLGEQGVGRLGDDGSGQTGDETGGQVKSLQLTWGEGILRLSGRRQDPLNGGFLPVGSLVSEHTSLKDFDTYTANLAMV